MSDLRIELLEIHEDLTDRAALTIQYRNDSDAVTLYINAGDEFEFSLLDLCKAMKACVAFRKLNSL